MINLPRESKTATEIVAWWTSMPIYVSWLITALLSVGGDTNNHNLQQSGRLLYCVTRRFSTNQCSISDEVLYAVDSARTALRVTVIRLTSSTCHKCVRLPLAGA